MSYIWCGIDEWCYRFNVIDVFTGQWPAFVLESRATHHDTMVTVNNAAATVAQIPPGLTLGTDNGSLYTSGEFRTSTVSLGITLEYILY